MSNKSKIEWTDATWNPATGCTPVSEGCHHCYARRTAQRFRGRFGYPADEPFRVTLHHDRLYQPLRWKRPRMIFVVSMGDLFHDDVPTDYIVDVLDVAYQAGLQHGHVFQFLTKRPRRMRKIVSAWLTGGICGAGPFCVERHDPPHDPPPFFWLGVTCENQPTADERIPILAETPAAVRFVSCEPLLSNIDIRHFLRWHFPCHVDNFQIPPIDWLICGGEAGSGARPMHPEWARSLRDQCQAAGVPYFFKQFGEWSPDNISSDKTTVVYSEGGSGNYCGVGVDHPGCKTVWRVGKRAAGRLLDGRTWDEMPEVKP